MRYLKWLFLAIPLVAQTTQSVTINGFPNQSLVGNVGFVFGLTLNGNTLNIGPGGCSTSSGPTTFVTKTAQIIINGGTESGTISVGCNGSGVETAYIGALTASNYSCVTITCTTGAVPSGAVITGTVVISTGKYVPSLLVSLPVVAPPGSGSGGSTTWNTNGVLTGTASAANFVGNSGVTCSGSIVSLVYTLTCTTDATIPTKTYLQAGTANNATVTSSSTATVTATGNQTFTAFSDKMSLRFTANFTSLGSINVDGLCVTGPPNNCLAYGSNGATTPVTTVSGQVYDFAYNATLNSNAGGWQCVSANCGSGSSTAVFDLYNGPLVAQVPAGSTYLIGLAGSIATTGSGYTIGAAGSNAQFIQLRSLNVNDTVSWQGSVPSNLTRIDIYLGGFIGSTAMSSNTIIWTATIGCLAQNGATQGGGSPGTPMPSNTATGVAANATLEFTMSNVLFAGCNARDQMYISITRSGTFAGGSDYYYFNNLEIVATRTLP